ncbi:MAG: putative metalloprotease with PDZ domain [Polaribacter sp.]|jgi:predicted metalloprotease with PDZ domain
MKISYKINIEDAKKHLIYIQLNIDSPLKQEQEFWLPDWIPGSYLIRDFSKNITFIQADERGETVQLTKIAKSRWALTQDVACLTISYKVYAWDLSVRSAHFDEQHCFFNGTSIFLAIDGFESEKHSVSIEATNHSNTHNWCVATSLLSEEIDKNGFGQYNAYSYEFLIDHPFEIAQLQTCSFMVNNTNHKMVFTEAPDNIDLNRIAKDVQAICEYECRYFADDEPPFENYLFMTFVMKNGFGGLEHISSTALHCSFADLPLIGEDTSVKSKEYQKFLSLCCHEYFHSWNVKRIKPEKFKALALQSEINTELLWFFEGVTSYIDELFLVRAKVISQTEYLDMLAKTISRYFKGAGRLNQTVADSSFDSWTKFYQQDENAVNAITSYYVKGSLVALALDFEIRQITNNQLSLDSLMRKLWQNNGKIGIGVAEKGIQSACEGLLKEHLGYSVNMDEFFQHHLYSTEELDLASIFNRLGLVFQLVAESKQADGGGYRVEIDKKIVNKPSLAMTHKKDPLGASVKSVIDDGAGSLSGLSNKDIIIAVNDVRVTSEDLDLTIQKYKKGTVVKISYFRRDKLYHTECLLKPSEQNTCYISFINEQKPNNLFLSWINS